MKKIPQLFTLILQRLTHQAHSALVNVRHTVSERYSHVVLISSHAHGDVMTARVR